MTLRPHATTTMLALSLVAACDIEQEPSLTGDVQYPPPITLTTGTPVIGQPLGLRVQGATPGQRVFFARGTALGAGPCLPALRGDCLDILGPQLVAAVTANAQGVATTTFSVGGNAAVGTEMVFQAVLRPPSGPVHLSAAIPTTVVHPNEVCDRLGNGTWPDASAARECDVLARINDVRANARVCGSQGTFPAVPPLTMHDGAQLAARVHSEWMAANQTLSHLSPGGPLGETIGQRMTNAGYAPWSTVGENILRGRSIPDEVVTRWLSSPSHCANIMSATKRDAGLGYEVDANGVPYWTLTLGRLQ